MKPQRRKEVAESAEKSMQTSVQPLGLPWKLLLMGGVIGLVGLTVIQFTLRPKIAFVRTGVLLEQYQGMIEARQAYEKKRHSWQANLDTLTSEINESIEVLEKEKPTLSQTKLQEREQALQVKQTQFVKYRDAIQQKAFQEDQQMTTTVLNRVNEFLEHYGKKHGYTLILGASGDGSLLYADEAQDITEAVIEALNQAYYGE